MNEIKNIEAHMDSLSEKILSAVPYRETAVTARA